MQEINESELEKKQLRKRIMDSLLEKFEFVTMHTNELYVYVDGIYRKDIAEKIIREHVEQELSVDSTRYDKAEVIDSIKCRTYQDWSFWNTSKNLICVANGVLDLETLTLEPHDSELHFLNKIPVWYLAKAELDNILKESRIDKFLHEITNTEEEVQAIYEFFGYCLYRGIPIHKAFMLVGDGKNGKTTLIDLLKEFLGKDNVANLSLQDLCQNRFAPAELYDKIANLYDDLTQKALWETGMFKQLTGNSPIDAEVKFIQKRKKLENTAKMIFACNLIPINEKDDTTAFWRRWNVFNFNKIFDIEHGNCDLNLLEKLTVKEELSFLLLKAIEGLKRLLQKGDFSNSKIIEETRKAWVERSNPIQSFAEKRLESNSESFIAKTVVYEVYKKFCAEQNLPVVDNNIFSRRLRTYLEFYDSQKSIEGKRVWCYLGIKLKNTTESTEPSKIDSYGEDNQ